MKLARFILDNMELILQEWESFAKTLFTVVAGRKALRDHAKKMLLVIAADLQKKQSKSEQIAKSKGEQRSEVETAAEEHGVARLKDGFSMNEIAAEFRALRASVTKLWGDAKKVIRPSDINDLIRFNEAIDQSLSESIDSYSLFKEQQTRHFNTMLSSSPDLSYIIDAEGVFLYVNKAMSELYQMPAHDMVGNVIYELATNLMSEEKSHIQSVLDTGEPCRGEHVFQSPSGRKYFFEYIYTPVLDENGKIEAIAGNSRDITERKITEAKIVQLANYDALTGLPNRRLFSERLEQAIKQMRREDKAFALLSLDLDKFKNVNDRLGHETGDLLLRQVGERISACVREIDTVARMGGDEFTIILTNINNAEQINTVTKKILREFTKPFEIKQQSVTISGSIGITLCPQDGLEQGILMGNADRAMYIAKNSGGNMACFFRKKFN